MYINCFLIVNVNGVWEIPIGSIIFCGAWALYSNPINCQSESWCMIALYGSKTWKLGLFKIFLDCTLDIKFVWVWFAMLPACPLQTTFSIKCVLLQIYIGMFHFHRSQPPYAINVQVKSFSHWHCFYDSRCWFLTMTMKVFDILIGQDMLISLKMLILQRAKVIGHESLAKKFDLKMLRAMGMSFTFVYMHLFNP